MRSALQYVGQRSARRQFLRFFRPLRLETLEDRALLTITPQLLADLNVTPFGVQVGGPIVEVGGVAYFAGGDGQNGMELWRSDGTAGGTAFLKDIRAGTDGSSPNEFTNVNGTVFFQTDDGISGRELWKTDGTAVGTVRVRDIRAVSMPESAVLRMN